MSEARIGHQNLHFQYHPSAPIDFLDRARRPDWFDLSQPDKRSVMMVMAATPEFRSAAYPRVVLLAKLAQHANRHGVVINHAIDDRLAAYRAARLLEQNRVAGLDPFIGRTWNLREPTFNCFCSTEN